MEEKPVEEDNFNDNKTEEQQEQPVQIEDNNTQAAPEEMN